MSTRGVGASLRGPGSPQQPTFLELFFDLAFVVTFSQLSRDLIAHLSWGGAVGTLLLLAIMRVWTGTMVTGIVVTAVGAELVITHPSGSTPPAWGVVLLGGPALFLVGRVGFEYTVFARVTRDRPIGVLVLAALTPAARLLPPLLVAVAAMAILAGIALADRTRVLGRPV